MSQTQLDVVTVHEEDMNRHMTGWDDLQPDKCKTCSQMMMMMMMMMMKIVALIFPGVTR